MKYQVIKTDKGYVAISNEPKKEGQHFVCTYQLKDGYVPIHKDYGMADACCYPIIATDTSFKLEGVPQFECEFEKPWVFSSKLKSTGQEVWQFCYNDEEGYNQHSGVYFKREHAEKGMKDFIYQKKGCYTEKDIKKAWKAGYNETNLDDYIQSLKQPKELVAIEVQECIIRHSQCVNKCASYPSECFCEMTKHIEITKSEQYPDGLLTVKKYYYGTK